MRAPLSQAQRRFFSTKPGTVGFIGLGNMGGPMATNLIKKGHKLMVFDLNTESVSALENEGATSASIKDIAANCSTVITMLPASKHVQSVYGGKDGVLNNVQEGTLLIDSSTIDPSVVKELAQEAEQKGCALVDAPVSGGVGGATGGTLTFMVGGKKSSYDSVTGVLSDMGKSIVHCGEEVGSGQVVKLCNNMVLGSTMVAVAEGMNLGIRKGIDPKLLASVFNTSTARCWSSDTYNPVPGVMEGVPASRGHEGGFGVDLMRKDLGLALNAAKEVGANTALGQATSDIYDGVSNAGSGGKDFGYIYQALKDGK